VEIQARRLLRLCRPDRPRAAAGRRLSRASSRRSRSTIARWITRPRPPATSCERSCAAPAGNSAWRSRRRPRSSSTPLRTVVLGIPKNLRGLRDRALLLVGWAADLRRSELVALEVADLPGDNYPDRSAKIIVVGPRPGVTREFGSQSTLRVSALTKFSRFVVRRRCYEARATPNPLIGL
jgi:hypothetical protein